MSLVQIYAPQRGAPIALAGGIPHIGVGLGVWLGVGVRVGEGVAVFVGVRLGAAVGVMVGQ